MQAVSAPPTLAAQETLAAIYVSILSRPDMFFEVVLPPFIPSGDSLLENLEVFTVGNSLNFGNGGWTAILAGAERIVKSELRKVNYEFWLRRA
jgi:hypothetical protein